MIRLCTLLCVLVFSLGMISLPKPKTPRQKAMHPLVMPIFYEMGKKYGLTWGGLQMGGGSKGYDDVGAIYLVKGIPSKQFTRKFLVEITHKLCDAINGSEAVRPYLIDYPFTPKNISVGIIVYQKDGSSVNHPEYFSHKVSSGTIRFLSSPKGGSFADTIVEIESFEEAERLVGK